MLKLVTRAALAASLTLIALPVAAQAEPFSVKTLHFAVKVGPNDDIACDVVGDLYKPASASAAHPAPAILTTNGFGGSKDDQADFAKSAASRGYVVLSYSGLGFGGSGCKIYLDDREYDGKAGSQLVTFLGGGKVATDGTKVDFVKTDSVGSDGQRHAFDPRVGMLGGSYGGQIQFAIAGIDPRMDTIIPIITWNDLSYSLAPNNTSFLRGVSYQTPGIEKFQWTSLFFGLGIADGITGASADPSRNVGCPNFDDRACAAKFQMDLTGAPNDATIAFSRHASVTSFLDDIRIPTLLAQGEADTLFNLQEAVATYKALKAAGTPVKMIWQSWGHSGGDATATGEFDEKNPEVTYEGRTFLQWFDHYLKDDPRAPSLDFSFYRDWVEHKGDATPAYGRAPSYPVGQTADLFLSGDGTLRDGARSVVSGALSFVTPALGLGTSYTETSALDQSQPVTDAAGTFARFETAPLGSEVVTVGIPSADLRLSAPAHQLTGQAGAVGELVLFFKLYDVAPDGSITLVHRLVSPARVAIPDDKVHVELPGIVHRFAKGHRIALVVAGGDTAYRGNNVAAPVSILTDPQRPGILHLPVAGAGDIGSVVEAAVPRGTGGACASSRRVTVSVPKRYRSRFASARVYVGKKLVARLRGKRQSARVKVRGTQKVRIVIRLRGGKSVTSVRRSSGCARPLR
jgi:predicted acyl esterase